VVERVQLPVHAVQSGGVVKHGLPDTLANGLLQLLALLGRHLPQNLSGAEQRGLVEQPLVERG
jgi:hypothetical protein